MGLFLNFLTDPDIQKTLTWLGGGITVFSAALWTVIKYFYPKDSGKDPAPIHQNSDASSNVFAEGGSMAVGGNVAIHNGLDRVGLIALIAVGFGIMILIAAFSGNQISAMQGGAAVGGDVTGSTVTISNQSDGK